MKRETVDWLPRSVASLVQRTSGSALANARSAADLLGTAIADRTELTRQLLTEHEPPDPGGALSPISPDECLRLLASCSLGRLAYIARARVPDIVPVNFSLHDGDLLIRSGPGPKLQAAERRELVAFEVDRIDEDAKTGWSVVVHGVAERVPWSDELHVEVGPSWATGPRQHVIRLSPRRITGRRLRG